MISKKNKFIFIYFPVAVFLFACSWLILKQPHKIKLLPLLVKQPLDKIRLEYAKKDCRNFSQTEIDQGYFDAFVTGYCKPINNNYSNRQDFLCAVGLNCSCPNGREGTNDCAITGPLSWASCKEFDDKQTDYCDLTASNTKPQPGQVAADWSCFPAKSTITIDGRNYLVTDKGSAITGRRFDIWFTNCEDAFKATGIYKVRLP